MRTTSTSISFPFKKPPSQKRKGHFSNIYESFAKLPTKITSINREKTPLIEFNVSERILEGYMDEKTQFILEKNSFDDKITKKKGLIKGISMKNQVIINEIKQKCKKTNFHIEKNENNDIIDKLMIKPSIKTRYEELTKEKTEYTLPSSYKALLKVFEAIDETLNFLKMRNIPSFFEEIKEDIKIMGLTFTLHDLKQILFLYPDAYILFWEKSLKKKNLLDLQFKIPLNENYIKSCFSSSRREIFKKILLDWLHQLHEDFLEKEGISKDLEEELKKEGVWHWKFDLEGVGEIPEGRLPDKPIAGMTQTLGDFLKSCEKEKINKELFSIMKKTVKETDVKGEALSKKLGISERLLEKIKEKEEKLQTVEKKTEGINLEFKKPKLRDIAESIKQHYTVKNVSNMFYVSLVEFLQRALYVHILNKEEIKDLIDIIIEICPYWLQKIKGSNGIIVRIDKSIVLGRVIEDINSYKKA